MSSAESKLLSAVQEANASLLDKHNPLVTPMLTDLYQVTMAYAYWKSGRQDEASVFDLFFRKNPFKGEFTIFAGLTDVLRFLHTYRFASEDVESLRARFPEWDAGFWDYLIGVDCSELRVYAIPEGSVVFPRVPLLRVEGPLGVAQLLETTLLNLINFASLVATNAARHRIAAGPNKTLLVFGLRRAQGPDGGLSASRYAYVGGFDGTSNVKASIDYGIMMKGTHAHSFVLSYRSVDDIKVPDLASKDGTRKVDMVQASLDKLSELGKDKGTNKGELAAFIAYAQAAPNGFLGLIDSYDTLSSGLWNFVAVALCLHDLGYQAKGIRLDSGDLGYLSLKCRAAFESIAEKYQLPWFATLNIVASNDLSEEVLYSLNAKGHSIDTFGIGTHLVTCKAQPALGCVYKLVEICNIPRIKISQDAVKITIPCKKNVFRLYNSIGQPELDILMTCNQPSPVEGKRILCRSPFHETKRLYMTPSRVEQMNKLVWDGKLVVKLETLDCIRDRVQLQIKQQRRDIMRALNPTPYKISVSSSLYTFTHDLLLEELPVHELI
jgi:nicotinate phosphoribosyltransferase